MVWIVPGEQGEAVADLLAMNAIGVEAVRTPPIESTDLLILADSLGIQVFQDVGPVYAPAGRLMEDLTNLERAVSEVAARSAAFPAATHIGLGEGVDTSDPRTCEALARLSEAVRLRAPRIRTYYVSHFLEDDRCANSVDLRLADAFLSARLVADLDGGVSADDFNGVGVGALRRGRQPDAPGGGLSQPGSAQSQARYLETALARLLPERATRRPAVFVYQWRDGFPESVVDDHFGLTESTGVGLPAYQVVRGFYTGDETIFAFPTGKPADDRTTWPVLLCWFIIAGLAAAYAGSPQFRQVALRYFVAHGFYREAVVEGRDVLPFVNVLLLAAVSLMIGLALTMVCLAVTRTHTAIVLSSWAPNVARSFASALVERPWLLVLFVGCLHALGYTLWTSVLSVVSRAGRMLLPAQTLMLTIWPLWPFILWGVIASTIPALPDGARLRISAGVAVTIAVTYAVSSARTLVDYHVVSKVPWYVTLSVGLLSPIGLLVLGSFGALIRFGPEMTYFWHLLARQ
jgi:hypothetical protein